MKKFDLENFPTSELAKKMMEYISKGWYERSYVGKWIFQVMGMELDTLDKKVRELPYQCFVDTATWGLEYFEQLYGLPIRDDLSYEERREIIRQAMRTKAPMNPTRAEQILASITGTEVKLTEHVDDYTFLVEFSEKEDGSIPILEAIEKLIQIKPSHKSWKIIEHKSSDADLYIGSALIVENDYSTRTGNLDMTMRTDGSIYIGTGVSKIILCDIFDGGLPELGGKVTGNTYRGAGIGKVICSDVRSGGLPAIQKDIRKQSYTGYGVSQVRTHVIRPAAELKP